MTQRLKNWNILVTAALLVAFLFGFVPAPQPAKAAGCDYILFIADVSIPDGTSFVSGANFTKTWRLKNIGSCTWTTGYSLVYVDGTQMGPTTSVYLPANVAPGGQIDLSVPMTAPIGVGTYRSNWQLKNANGVRFGIGYSANMSFWAEIRVIGGTGGSIPTPVYPPGVLSPTPPTSTCDRVTFIDDVTVPDGTVFAPNTPFTKTWRIKNTGTCTWTTNHRLVFVIGDKLGGPDSMSMVSTVGPNTSIDISFDLVAPAVAGAYRGYWQLLNEKGEKLGIGPLGDKPWWVDIVVSGSAPGSTSTPTRTPGGIYATPTKTPVNTRTPTPTPGVVYNFDFDTNLNLSNWWNSAGDPLYSRQPDDQTWDEKGFVVQTYGSSFFSDGQSVTNPLLTVPQNYGLIRGIYNPIRIQTKMFFLATVGCDPNAPLCDAKYQVGYQYYDSNGVLVPGVIKALARTYTASPIMNERYTSISYELPSVLVGKDVQFIFEISANGSSVDDRVLWGNPRLVNIPGPVGPGITPTPAVTPQPIDSRSLVFDFGTYTSGVTWTNGSGVALPFPGYTDDTRGFVQGFGSIPMEDGFTYDRPSLLMVPEQIGNGSIQGVFPAIPIENGDHLVGAIGCKAGYTGCSVRYYVDYQIGSNTPVRMLDLGENLDGMTKRVDINLDGFNELAGRNVKFIFIVSANGSPLNDYAVWISPRLVNPVSRSIATRTPTPTPIVAYP